MIDQVRTWPYGALAGLMLATFGVILVLNGGVFTYTLDDAYIHLAFGEQLAHGHFGLVAQEPASPSSSVLYPLLLMPLAGTTLHQWQPLLWNIVAVFASFALWRFLFSRLVLEQNQLRTGLLSGVLALLAVILLNQAGLAFSGMEASLQIALSLATTIGLIEFLTRDRLRWWLVVGIVVGPLIRYENLTLSLPAIVIVAALGRWRPAALSLLVIAATLGGYAVYCLSIGMPPLPGSLLMKTGLDAPATDWVSGIVMELKFVYEAVINRRGDVPVLLLIGLLALNFLFCRTQLRRGRERVLIALALFVLIAQFMFGGHGSLGRYDAYAGACGVAVAAFANRRAIGLLAARGWQYCALAVAAILICVFPYAVFMAAATPLAANDIYLQQFQMRRLLVEFAQVPAVVNDAGLTAYRNPAGVVDVAGLGSEEIRHLQRDRRFNATQLQRLAEERGVKLALVYANWRGDELPKQWTAIGRLIVERPLISVAGKTVTIYAVASGDVHELTAKLHAFAATLPPGATLQFAPFP